MTIDIVRYKKIPLFISALLVVVSLAALFVYGLKPGIDFTGGSLIEVRFSAARPGIDAVHNALAGTVAGDILVQPTNDDAFAIKTGFVTETDHQKMLTALRKAFETGDNKVLETRVDTIGPAISSQLRHRAFMAAFAVDLAILLYLAYAFRKVSDPVPSWAFGLATIVAHIHDVLIPMGVFAVLGHYYGVEVDISFVVALLTILGYSVNDTIVVFDRIREKLIHNGPKNFEKTVNEGVSETVVRSLVTSGITLVMLLMLFLFGSPSTMYFALALIIGIFFGTYSSIFLASPLLLVFFERMNQKK